MVLNWNHIIIFKQIKLWATPKLYSWTENITRSTSTKRSKNVPQAMFTIAFVIKQNRNWLPKWFVNKLENPTPVSITPLLVRLLCSKLSSMTTLSRLKKSLKPATISTSSSSFGIQLWPNSWRLRKYLKSKP